MKQSGVSIVYKSVFGVLAAVYFTALLGLGAVQEPSASQSPAVVSGCIRDPGGSPLAGAVVELAPRQGGAAKQVTTGSEGAFRFENLQSGSYVPEISAPSFRPYHLEVELPAGETRTLNVSLEIAPVVTDVIVRDEAEDLRQAVKRNYEINKSVTRAKRSYRIIPSQTTMRCAIYRA